MVALDRIIAVRNRKTVYRDGDKCIKVFDETFSKADILNEALNQARVENIGLNVPKILEVAMIDGKWAIVSDYIPGKTLEELMMKEPENKQAYFEQFVDIQIQILSKKCPLLNRIKEKMNSKISMADIDATTRYELHTRLNGMPNADQVCHGDFDPSNVIISENGPFIIDWSHVTQGNPEADAARTYLRFWLSGNIQGAENYLDIFCKKSSFEKQMIQRWMPIVATSQSVKSKPEEREFLLSWANVVEYQ